MTTRLEVLQSIEDPQARALAATAYVQQHYEAIRDATAVRNGAIRELVAEHGVTKAARMAEVSVSLVKTLRTP